MDESVRTPMVAEEGIESVNLYDIFANIVPGLSFLFGIMIPLNVRYLVDFVFGREAMVQFTLAYLILLVALAFITGQLLQAFGSRFDGDHGFPRFVQEIRGEDVDSRYEVTEFDEVFWHFCRERFVLSDNFESYDRLFKSVLAYLEHSQRTRALRLQALYLFARGVFVAGVLLTVFYTILLLSLYYDYVPFRWEFLFRSQLVIATSAVLSATVSYISYKERRKLESDWVKYAITEFYLDIII